MVFHYYRVLFSESVRRHLPEINISQALPKQFQSDRLSVMHCAFTRVVAYYSVHHDGLLPVCYQLISSNDVKVRTYRAVNHPFLPRDQLAVCVGPGGSITNDMRPIVPVMRPLAFISRMMQAPHRPLTSIKNSHLQPGNPFTPRR